MERRFAVGHRVVVVAPTYSTSDLDDDITGYYGKVVAVPDAGTTAPMVLVSLQGRISGPVDPINLDLHGDDPYPMYEHELDHAD